MMAMVRPEKEMGAAAVILDKPDSHVCRRAVLKGRATAVLPPQLALKDVPRADRHMPCG